MCETNETAGWYADQKKLPMLGIISPDIIILDAKKSAEEGKLIEAAEFLKKELMNSSFEDWDADMQQQGSPNVYTKLVGKRIEVLRKYFDEDR